MNRASAPGSSGGSSVPTGPKLARHRNSSQGRPDTQPGRARERLTLVTTNVAVTLPNGPQDGDWLIGPGVHREYRDGAWHDLEPAK